MTTHNEAFKILTPSKETPAQGFRKLRIAVDLDNTSGDYTNALRHSLAKILNVADHEINEKFPIVNDYAMGNNGWHEMDTQEKFFALHSQAVSQGMFLNLEAYDNVSEVLWRAHAKGHHIRVVTARFLKPGDRYIVGQTTFQWLDDNQIPVDDIAFTDKKTDIDADVYIDDSPSNIRNLRAAGKTVIIYHQEYNKDMDGLRAHNWLEVEAILEELSHVEVESAVEGQMLVEIESTGYKATKKEGNGVVRNEVTFHNGNVFTRLLEFSSRNIDYAAKHREQDTKPQIRGLLPKLDAFVTRNL